MTVETTNTSKFQLAPEGRYSFTVDGKPEKRRSKSGNSTFRIWKLKCEGLNRVVNIIVFPWDSKELLLSLGGKEIEKNQIEWDDENVSGMKFDADVVHVDDGKGGKTEKLANIEAQAWDDTL